MISSQHYWILKQPGKAVFYLFTIMILLSPMDSLGHGYCNKPCFGPVTKIKIYNDRSHGNLYVDGNNVKSNGPGSMAIYKVSSGRDFYLYDAYAKKFICWNKTGKEMRHHKKTLVARKYRPRLMRFCRFIDEPTQNGYVNLVPSFNKSLKMMFKANGTPTNKLSKYPTRERFLMQVVGSSEPSDPCGCPEAKHYFCEKPLRKMKELNDICNKHYRI
ncbi:uncharacterized protein isoform X2 [Leptinotarsa decemlineata]|uniref:uncharacterized protein isoform X2 n=1 Tax=Leptinotarsa decemlineata TaxID=7539 RepID=UPI003D3086CD